MFTADDLRHEREVRDGVKYTLFRNTLNQCLEVIKHKNESCSEMWLFYDVPSTLAGEPLYNQNECTKYLIPMLSQCGFYVKRCKPGNIIFISWHPEHKQTKKSLKRTEVLAINLESKEKPLKFHGKCPLVEDLK
jgi:hypothetical protein